MNLNYYKIEDTVMKQETETNDLHGSRSFCFSFPETYICCTTSGMSPPKGTAHRQRPDTVISPIIPRNHNLLRKPFPLLPTPPNLTRAYEDILTRVMPSSALPPTQSPNV